MITNKVIDGLFSRFDAVDELFSTVVTDAEEGAPWFILHKTNLYALPILREQFEAFFRQSEVFDEYAEAFDDLLSYMLANFSHEHESWSDGSLAYLEKNIVVRQYDMADIGDLPLTPFITPIVIIRLLSVQLRAFAPLTEHFDKFADRYQDLVLSA